MRVGLQPRGCLFCHEWTAAVVVAVFSVAVVVGTHLLSHTSPGGSASRDAVAAGGSDRIVRRSRPFRCLFPSVNVFGLHGRRGRHGEHGLFFGWPFCFKARLLLLLLLLIFRRRKGILFKETGLLVLLVCQQSDLSGAPNGGRHGSVATHSTQITRITCITCIASNHARKGIPKVRKGTGRVNGHWAVGRTELTSNSASVFTRSVVVSRRFGPVLHKGHAFALPTSRSRIVGAQKGQGTTWSVFAVVLAGRTAVKHALHHDNQRLVCYG